MPETPGQKLSILRFLVLMIEKRLVADGTMSNGQLEIILTHPDKQLTWLEKDDPFWLEIKYLGIQIFGKEKGPNQLEPCVFNDKITLPNPTPSGHFSDVISINILPSSHSPDRLITFVITRPDNFAF